MAIKAGGAAGPLLSASVVMYGMPEKAHATVHSLCAAVKSPGFALYLIDNASPGNALEKVKAMGLPENVICIALNKNKGYGGGHNSVLPLLTSRYHAVVNPDIRLEGDVPGQMAAWMEENTDAVICAPRLVFPDGREQPLPKRRPAVLPLVARQTGLGFLHKHESSYLMLDRDLSKPVDVEFISGSFFLIRTGVYKKIGGFDEGYFMYVEDADITQKALGEGRAVYLPQFVAIHEWQREARRIPRKFIWQCKSMLRYFAKWGFKWK